jgi:putative hydrolase of the HAD superfamily
MNNKVLFLDLDNTIYPVSAIAAELFKDLFELIKNNGEFESSFEEIKLEIQRTPFQKVASQFNFSPALLKQCVHLHETLSYPKAFNYFEDYEWLRQLPNKKYLVTSGFTILQESKIEQMGIKGDFEAIYIIDLQRSDRTKKDVFEEIIRENQLLKKEILIIGDDINSEIKAGNELGIETVLYDKLGKYSQKNHQKRITDFKELSGCL